MTPADWINLLSAVIAGIPVLIPFLYKRLEKRDRLTMANYLMELLKARQELELLHKNDSLQSRPTVIGREAFEILEEIDQELAIPTRRNDYGFFTTAAFAESVLFVGAAFTQLSEWYSRLRKMILMVSKMRERIECHHRPLSANSGRSSKYLQDN